MAEIKKSLRENKDSQNKLPGAPPEIQYDNKDSQDKLQESPPEIEFKDDMLLHPVYEVDKPDPDSKGLILNFETCIS